MVHYDKNEDVLRWLFEDQKREGSTMDKDFTKKVMHHLPEENLFFRMFILLSSLFLAFLIIAFNYNFVLSYEHISNFLCVETGDLICLLSQLSQQTSLFYFSFICFIGLSGYYTFWIIKKV